MSSKSRKPKKATYEMSLTKAVSNALVIFMWGFCCAFQPDKETMDILKHEIFSVRDSINAGALTIPDIKKALKDDYDWEVS